MNTAYTETSGAIDLYHYLMWRVRCNDATATEFERLFHQVAERLNNDDFLRIRPYGSKGDRKMDGVFLSDQCVFQVYSPDSIIERELLRKIDEDLAGAVEAWGDDLRKWVFVYNVRRGLPPDTVFELKTQREKHPSIEISLLSEYGLWKKAREGLSISDRNEILGFPPVGWLEMFMSGSSGARLVLLHENQRPIDLSAAVEALEPERPFGPPVRLAPSVQDLDWDGAADFQEQEVRKILENASEKLAKFAVFGLSDIPLLVHLGFVLTDRLDVRLFQYHRDRTSWAWPEVHLPIEQIGIDLSALAGPTKKEGDVVIRFSLSARISEEHTRAVVKDAVAAIDVGVRDPDVMWLQSPEQLDVLKKRTRDALKIVRQTVPNCRSIHLFYAGPAPGAIAVGQSINPTMNPEVITYNYRRGEVPRYERAVRLSGLG